MSQYRHLGGWVRAICNLITKKSEWLEAIFWVAEGNEITSPHKLKTKATLFKLEFCHSNFNPLLFDNVFSLGSQVQ